MRDKILKIASEQFGQYGIRAITMEDIARLAGISKKTLYQEFKDKKELVKETFSMALVEDQQAIAKFMEEEDGVIEHLLHTSKMVCERLATLNPMVLLEIQKYFPDVWKMFNEFKERIIVTDIVNVIEKGKALGYFRPEINAKLLANMRVNQISAAMNPVNFPEVDFDLVTLHKQMLDHFLHGIFTETGRKAYMEKRNSNQSNGGIE